MDHMLMTNLLDIARFVDAVPVTRASEALRTDPAEPAVIFDSVGKVFAGAKGRTASGTTALAKVDLSVARGEVFGIIGRSGAGKSTLLRLVNGLEKPTSGAVRAPA